MDVIYLGLYGNTSLNSLEREKLRRFMDKGGVLWVDLSSSVALDAVNTLPMPFAINGTAGATPFSLDFSQPLLTYPISLSQNDALLMQSENAIGVRDFDLAATPYAGLEGIMQTLRPDSLRLLPVAVDALGAFIMVGRVGDGYMVVTSRGVGRTLNRIPLAGGGYNANIGPQAYTPASDRATDAAAKLAINLVYLSSGYKQASGGSRGARSTPIDLDPPALQRAVDNNVSFAPASQLGYSPAVVGKGAVAICSQDRLYVYDTNPKQDLDGDGDPDDGARDYSTGAGYDLLWASDPLSGPISAPCIAGCRMRRAETFATRCWWWMPPGP
jgi:hypothetical protein